MKPDVEELLAEASKLTHDIARQLVSRKGVDQESFAHLRSGLASIIEVLEVCERLEYHYND